MAEKQETTVQESFITNIKSETILFLNEKAAKRETTAQAACQHV